MAERESREEEAQEGSCWSQGEILWDIQGEASKSCLTLRSRVQKRWQSCAWEAFRAQTVLKY